MTQPGMFNDEEQKTVDKSVDGMTNRGADCPKLNQNTPWWKVDIRFQPIVYEVRICTFKIIVIKINYQCRMKNAEKCLYPRFFTIRFKKSVL